MDSRTPQRHASKTVICAAGRILIALEAGPATVAQLEEKLGIEQRTITRGIEYLQGCGDVLHRERMSRRDVCGMRPDVYSLKEPGKMKLVRTDCIEVNPHARLVLPWAMAMEGQR